MTPGVLGALAGAVVGARAVNAALDGQMARASGEDASKFATIRRLAGPVVIVTTIAEIAVVGYVLVQALAG